jgi:hypothetical protein
MRRPGGHGEKVVVRIAKFLADAEGLDPNDAGFFAYCGFTAYVAPGKIIRREGPIDIIGADYNASLNVRDRRVPFTDASP